MPSRYDTGYDTNDPGTRQALLDQLKAQQQKAQAAVGVPAAGATTAASGAATAPYTPPAAGVDLSGRGEGGAARGLNYGADIADWASTGAKVGSVVPGIGTAIGAGIGAAGAGIKDLFAARHNDTKGDREDFAKQLGYGDTTALWKGLSDKLPADQANELRDRALNRIGRHDTGADQQWMQDVQAALAAAPAKQTAQDQGTKENTTVPDNTQPAAGDPSNLRTREGIEAYYKSRGVTPYEGSVDYWAGKAKDPAFADDKYFADRLSQADEFSNKGAHWDWTQGQRGGGAAPSATASADKIAGMLGSNDTYNQLMQRLQSVIGAPASGDRNALLSLLDQGNNG